MSGFNRGYVAFDDPITEDQNDVEVLLYQDEGNSVALYFNVDSEHAKVAKNTENPRVATGGMYKKETCSYHFDWDTGDILVTADNGNDVYRVKADDGYAFYDWHIYNSNNEPVDLELNTDVTENLFFYGHIWPAAKLNLSVGAEESHECFKITSSTNEDYNPGYSIESEEFNCDLYEGTKVTFEGDRVKTYCEINEENADPYIEEYDLQAIPKENYSFAQWTLNGEVVEDGTTLTVEQFKNLNIGVNYMSTITPTPDNPDIITTNTAQTGDNVGIFAIVGLLASVIVSYSISRKAWKKN